MRLVLIVNLTLSQFSDEETLSEDLSRLDWTGGVTMNDFLSCID